MLVFSCSIVGEGRARQITASDHRAAARLLVQSGDAQPGNYIVVNSPSMFVRFLVGTDRRLCVSSHYDASPDRNASASFFRR